MPDSIFVGRKTEWQQLQNLYHRQRPHLIVIKGRRRIGKSRLIHEFSKSHQKSRFFNFSAIAPQNKNPSAKEAQAQRDHFSQQLKNFTKGPLPIFTDWAEAFECLSQNIKKGDIVLLDEISWMGSGDPYFIPKFKSWWDKQSCPIMCFLCGSVSTWIEENILNSTALFGRIHLSINLDPLSIPDSASFLKKEGFSFSDLDIFKLLGTAGGIPWYLEQFKPNLSADENIKALGFLKNALWITEFQRIFHDLFSGKGESYKKILSILKNGAKTLAEVRQSLNFSSSGTLSNMMEQLITAGFVKKEGLWSFKTKKPLKQSLYRLADPYMRFYLKVIEPNLKAILNGQFEKIPLSTLPGYDTHMGLQLELLLLQNPLLIQEAIGISPIDVLNSGPYRQNKTSKQKGCQIDYLIQSTTQNLFICEFKFRSSELGVEIIKEMENKISSLKVPRGFAPVPVLIHIGGVSDTVATSSYFYRIIDMRDFLYPKI